MRNCDRSLAGRILPILGVVLLLFACAAARRGGSQDPGTHAGRLSVAGIERTYLLHVPPPYDPSRPVALVLALHGGHGNAAKMEQFTGLSALADREGFLVAYPEAVEGNWNDGRGIEDYRSQREGIDDVAFLTALIHDLTQTWSVAMSRVYITGVSNGAMMSLHMACEAAGEISAAAAVVGSLPEDLAPACRPSRPIPILMINGTDDPLVPWEGGYVHFRKRKLGRVLSVPAAVEFWRAANGCTGAPEVTEIPDRFDDGTHVLRSIYTDCRNRARVTFYEIRGGGHNSPGASRRPPRLPGGQDLPGDKRFSDDLGLLQRPLKRFSY